jgi:hypothetical protein
VDKRIAQAAAFKMWCRDASIPEAMRACKFTLAESSNPAKQMAVRRQWTIKNNNQPTMLAESGHAASNGWPREGGGVGCVTQQSIQLMKTVGRHGDEDDYPPSLKT